MSADMRFVRPPRGRRVISPCHGVQPSSSVFITAVPRLEITVKRILAGLGLSPPDEEKPPPIRKVVRVPVHDEGREIQATCLLRPPPPTPSGGTTGGNRSSRVER